MDRVTFTETDEDNLRMQYEQRNPGGFETNSVQSQGEKTVNFQVNPSLFADREESSDKLDRQDRFGSVVGSSTSCDILAGEAVYYRKYGGGSVMRGTFGPGGAKGPPVFSSFNGEKIEGTTQEETEEGYSFAGFAKIPWYFNTDEQPDANGVSVRVGGTGTTLNTGTKEIHVGDLMCWRLPSIFLEEREKEKLRLPTAKGQDSSKMYAIWEPFDYRNVTHIFYNAMQHLLSDVTGENTSLRLLDIDDNVSEMPAEQEAAILLKHDTLQTVLSGVATLEQYGLVTINVPNRSDPLHPSAYASYNTVLSTGLKDLNAHDVTRRTERGNVALTLNIDRPVNKEARARKLEFLAYATGLLYDENRPHLRPHHTMVTALLARCNFGLLATPADRAAFTLAAVLPGHSRKRARDGEIHYNLSTFAGKIARHEAEAKIDLIQCMKLASERLDSRIGFKATSHAYTGEIVDYAL